jgi:hypothetical protein
MEKYLFIAQCDCNDPAREKDFIEWLDNIHIPDALATPGFVLADRYININPEENKRPKYMAIYEIETNDIKKFDAEFHKTMKKMEESGRIASYSVPERAYPFATTYYKKVKTIKKNAGK